MTFALLYVVFVIGISALLACMGWIAANDVSRSDIGFGSDRNAVTLIGRNGAIFELGPAPKIEIARRLLEIVTGCC